MFLAAALHDDLRLLAGEFIGQQQPHELRFASHWLSVYGNNLVAFLKACFGHCAVRRQIGNDQAVSTSTRLKPHPQIRRSKCPWTEPALTSLFAAFSASGASVFAAFDSAFARYRGSSL